MKKFILPLLVIALYLSPIFILGQNSHPGISDNLDSNVVWFKILAQSNKIFSSPATTMPEIMNAPRSSLGSEFSIILLLFYLFKPFAAYVINLVIVHLIAFWGMYFLLAEIFKNNKDRTLISIGVALTFALLPFWGVYGISIAGQPFLLFCLIKMRRERKFWPYLLFVIFFPFYSLLVLSGIFILLVFALFLLFDLIKRKRFDLKLLLSFILLAVFYALVEWRLIYDFIFKAYVSHRQEFSFQDLGLSVSLMKSLLESKYNFFHGQQYAQSLHYPIIIASALMAIAVSFIKKAKLPRHLFSILFFIAVLSLFYGMWSWSGLDTLKTKNFWINAFQFQRIQWLQPLFWYIVFALVLIYIKDKWKYGKQLVINLIIVQAIILFANNQELRFKNELSFKQYYSAPLFVQIKDYIGTDQPSFKIASIGVNPAVAQYNGFYTIDGYLDSYPLSYKHGFRKVIENELAKNENARKYFDDFGSRVYIFVNELWPSKDYIAKNDNLEIKNLRINAGAIKNLGGRYLLSAVEIENYKNNNLEFLKDFQDEESPYHIFLYKII